MDISWEEVSQAVKDLHSRIDYAPDAIVGITRGGLVPARLFSSLFKVKDMYCLTAKKIGMEREVLSDILADLSGKKVLLVEDVLETGKSLKAAKEYLEQKGAEVKTVCLYTTLASKVMPDYYLGKVAEVPRFPWE